MRATRVLLAAVLLVPSAAAQSLEEWADRLGSPDFEERELAYRALWEAGREALPHVERAAASEDLETRERAERLLPLVRWSILPALREAVGPAIDLWEERPPAERVELVRKASGAGPAALEFLRRVVLDDGSEEVVRAALEAWREVDGPGVLGWVEAAVDAGAPRSVLLGWLGARYAWMARREIPTDRLERATEALLVGGSEIHPDWIGALLAAGLDGLAARAVEGGRADFEVARRFLEQGRPETAARILREVGATTTEVVVALLDHRYPDEARREALAAPDLAGSLAGPFEVHLEFETALELARLAGDAGRVRTLLRAMLRDPEGPPDAGELLELGLAEEAFALVGDERSDLAFRAVIASGRPWPHEVPESADLAAIVHHLDRGQAAKAAGLLVVAGDDLDLATELYGATGDGAVLAAAHPAAEGWRAFLPLFDRGRLAEADGRPGDALGRYAEALVEIGCASNVRLAWHAEEVARKGNYLSKVPGAREAALEKAERPLVRIEILRLCGDWAGASAAYDGLDPAAEPPLVLEEAWTHAMAGRADRVRGALERLAPGGAESWAARVAAHLVRMADPDDPAARLLLERPAPKGAAYEAAFFLTCHGLDDAALAEWARIEADHHASPADFHFHLSNAWEYTARILWRTGRDPARAADLLERSMRATVALPEEGYRILELGANLGHRARVFLLRARAARAAGDEVAAFRSARQALGLDPFAAEAASIVLDLSDRDPEFAARMWTRHVDWLRRRQRIEPANEAIAARLQALGD